MAPASTLRSWQSLSIDEQTALRQDYQAEIDRHPLTCSLDEKTARFTNWLGERNVSFSIEDIRRPKT